MKRTPHSIKSYQQRSHLFAHGTSDLFRHDASLHAINRYLTLAFAACAGVLRLGAAASAASNVKRIARHRQIQHALTDVSPRVSHTHTTGVTKLS
jgi:hypothetical protein